MGKVSESIFDGKDHTIPMADVQHIEKCKHGIFVITKHTKWNWEHDEWENAIFLGDDEGKEFRKAWCSYRYELEKETIKGGE